jgi:hypothetical protein
MMSAENPKLKQIHTVTVCYNMNYVTVVQYSEFFD